MSGLVSSPCSPPPGIHTSGSGLQVYERGKIVGVLRLSAMLLIQGGYNYGFADVK